MRGTRRLDATLLGLMLPAAWGAACAPAPERDLAMGQGFAAFEPAQQEQAVRVCSDGETVAGIDISKWQGSIDWALVAGEGIDFACIRVSDGLDHFDQFFASNWAGAGSNGILRGAYQFFRSNEDPVAQADLLLETMGPLTAGDLPPVIDVESTDGQDPATVAANVGLWLDRVEEVLGVKGIIYTSPVFWEDHVASDAHSDHPLWIANWGVDCPRIPDQWTGWVFWQTSASGSYSGISGDVDTDLFNGSRDLLRAFAAGEDTCGDGHCTGYENPAACPADCPTCAPVPASGGVIDDVDLCFHPGGDPRFLRQEDGIGYGGGLRWSQTWVSATAENYGRWQLDMEQEGDYLLEVFLEPGFAAWERAGYRVRHAGATVVVELDQSTGDGWTELGTFHLLAGGDQWLQLGDNVDDGAQAGKVFVLDALRITPAGGGGGVDAGEVTDDGARPVEPIDGCEGCRSAGGSAQTDPGLLLLTAAMVGAAVNRRQCHRRRRCSVARRGSSR